MATALEDLSMSETAKLNQELSKIARTLNDVRETLFECSRESVKGEDNEWHKAEALFSLAKSVDGLRRQTLSLMNGATDSRVAVGAISPPKGKVSAKVGKKNKKDYPHYRVRGRSLIKTGLGRDEKTEYEHIVPRSEFEKVIAKVATLATSRKEFTAEAVQENLDCPMYQTYMVLALLRQMDLLEMPRRGSYQAPANGFPSSPDAIWDQVHHA
jgi:hypothetical protein